MHERKVMLAWMLAEKKRQLARRMAENQASDAGRIPPRGEGRDEKASR
jgi:hypothetical protein